MNRREFLKAVGLAPVAPSLLVTQAAEAPLYVLSYDDEGKLSRYVSYAGPSHIAAWKLTQHPDGSYSREPITIKDFYKHA